MEKIDNPLRSDAQAALTGLERLLRDRSEELIEEIPHCVRRLVALRDTLISRRRSGDVSSFGREWLEGTNAILSSVVGAEFPIEGLHRERIEAACGALRQLLASS